MGNIVTLGEVEDVIKCMGRDKSPGPYGWNVEYFGHFFDLLGQELIDAVEESSSNINISC